MRETHGNIQIVRKRERENERERERKSETDTKRIDRVRVTQSIKELNSAKERGRDSEKEMQRERGGELIIDRLRKTYREGERL